MFMLDALTLLEKMLFTSVQSYFLINDGNFLKNCLHFPECI